MQIYIKITVVTTITFIMPHPHRAEVLSDDARLTSVCREHRA